MELEDLKSYLEESKSRAEARAEEELINLASGKGKKSDYMYTNGYISALDMVIRQIEGRIEGRTKYAREN